MANESILCLGGLLILITLFITWYRSEDSLVSLPRSSSLRASVDRGFVATSSNQYLRQDFLILFSHTYPLSIMKSLVALP